MVLSLNGLMLFMQTRKFSLLLTVISFLCLAFHAIAENPSVEVIDPYLEMHSGPGRYYPVVNVVEQGDSVKVVARKVNWYRVISDTGIEGWSKAEQIDRTLFGGVPVDTPLPSRSDLLKMDFSVGFVTGSADGAETIAARAGYKPIKWGGMEVEYGVTFPASRDLSYYAAQIVVEPIPIWNFSPIITYGTGKTNFQLKPGLIGEAAETGDFERFGIGLNYYIGYNFVMRTEYQWYTYTLTDNLIARTTAEKESNAWVIGFNSFF